MKIKVILNVAAGRGKAKKAIPTIKDIFKARNLTLDMDVTQGPGEATHLSRQACKKDFDIIVAAGGDGIVNEVVNGMVGSNSALGVIPIGLGNDFAKGMNIPSKLELACLTIHEGALKQIDVGKVNDRYFVNGLGIGFDAYVAKESQKIKWFFNPNWIYLYTVLRTLFRYKAPMVKINFDDVTLDKRVLLVAIGNGRSSGGGFLLTPEAEFDDGLMDVCIIEMTERLKLLKSLPKAIRGTHIKLPYVRTLKTKKITIDSSSLLLAHVEGEILQSQRYQIEILPKMLRVMVPR